MAFAETSSYNIAASSLFFYFYPIYYFRPFLSCSLPVVTQSRGQIFWEIGPESPYTWAPVDPLSDGVWVCVFFRQLFGHFLFFNMSLKESQFSGWRKLPSFRGRKELIEHVRNISVSICQKRRERLDFCTGNVCKLRSWLVITQFQYGISFGPWTWLDTGLTQSDLRIFARFFFTDCFGVLRTGSFRTETTS